MAINNEKRLATMIMQCVTPDTFGNIQEFSSALEGFELFYGRNLLCSEGILKNVMTGHLEAKGLLPPIEEAVSFSTLIEDPYMHLIETDRLNVCIITAGKRVGICLAEEYDQAIDLILKKTS